MPIIEYQCEKCGERTEILQKTSILKEKCDKCDGDLRRLWRGGLNLQFNGTGFYCTDYRTRKD